jgi:hypothetical protein
LSSFLAIENYTPLFILAVGLLTFVGLWGAGTILLYGVRLHLPSPWNHVTAVLLGVQALSLAVQIVGITEIASRPVLSAIWWMLVILGGVTLVFSVHIRPAIVFSGRDRWALLPLAVVGIATLTDLLIAVAPSTKIDELYYHMLLPSRIVSDGALHFYREPWEGAIFPDMSYQIAAAPIHAVGYPDAANVVSWRIIQGDGNPATWAAFWVGSLCVGIYPAVWWVTGGAHAMGDLAMAAAVVAFCSRDRLLGSISPAAYAAMLSVLLLSASTSKISLLPLSIAILCLSTWPLLYTSLLARRGRVVFAIAAPWVIFFCPISLWTWIQSGSPFGPMLAGSFGPSIYPPGWTQEIFQYSREANQIPPIKLAQYIAVGYSPLVWLGVVGAIVATRLLTHIRLTLACLLGLQCVLIYWLLPYDARFLGGFQYGLVIVFALFVRHDIRDRLTSIRDIAVACALFLIPWLGVQIYYAKLFFPVSLGLEKRAFYERYVAFYTDYIKLDRLLSSDTVILVQDFRLDSAYAPRPVFFNTADLPHGKPIVLFGSPDTIEAASASLANHKLGSVVYENAQAVTETYRTPGMTAKIGPLRVVRLTNN